jgi:hypothetical protein
VPRSAGGSAAGPPGFRGVCGAQAAGSPRHPGGSPKLVGPGPRRRRDQARTCAAGKQARHAPRPPRGPETEVVAAPWHPDGVGAAAAPGTMVPMSGGRTGSHEAKVGQRPISPGDSLTSGAGVPSRHADHGGTRGKAYRRPWRRGRVGAKASSEPRSQAGHLSCMTRAIEAARDQGNRVPWRPGRSLPRHQGA